MFASTSLKRLCIGLVPIVLFASLLGNATVGSQNGADEGETLVPFVEGIQPTAVVSVLGDGFLGSPTVAPIPHEGCRTSGNGPVEQAARRILDTTVVVENLSCPGAQMDEVVRDQLSEMRSDTDVVVVGGVGLEFDWPSLAAACLTQQTRSISGCQDEAGLARANASNSFLLWQSFLAQARRVAPEATVVIVAPPAPVSARPEVVGRACCGPTVDTSEQVRAAFRVASALRQAVVETDRSPVVLIETDTVFAQNLLTSDDPWLVGTGLFMGTLTAQGTAALADRLGAVMPVGSLPEAAPNSAAQIALVLGATVDDGRSHEALAAAAPGWFEQFEQANTDPSVLIVSAATSATSSPDEPPPESEPPVVEPPVVEPPVVEPPDDAEGEPGERSLQEQEPTEPVVAEPVVAEPVVAEPVVAEPVVAEPVVSEPVAVGPVISPGPLTTATDLAAELQSLPVSKGITTLEDLTAAIVSAGAFLDGPAAERSIIVRADSLILPETRTAEFAEILARVPGEIEIIASTTEVATRLSELTVGSRIIVSTADAEELAAALPSPDPVLALTGLDVAESFEFVHGETGVVQAAISLTEPTDAVVTWSVGDAIVGVGQRAEIDTTNIGIGQRNVVVTVTTDQQELRALSQFSVTLDGDGIDDAVQACRSVFDEDERDIDGDGRTGACDNDNDGDGIPDAFDPCPDIANNRMFDSDLDGLPNVCDAELLDGPAADSDLDGFPDVTDNCPTVPSSNQLDTDHDGIGNACELGTINPVCTITGTEGDDELTGTAGNDIICGLGGNDTINALDGNDIIFAGPGDDRIDGGTGRDRVYGGLGNDVIGGNIGVDVLLGEAGNDRIFGGIGADSIDAGLGNDTVSGGVGDDLIFGGDGDDSLAGNDGADVINGGSGQDTITGGAGPDRLRGGLSPDRIIGGRGHDVFINVGENDVARGDTGNDIIDGTPIRFG